MTETRAIPYMGTRSAHDGKMRAIGWVAGWPGGRVAGWQSGYAEDCKSFYAGSIPAPASILIAMRRRFGAKLSLQSDSRGATW